MRPQRNTAEPNQDNQRYCADNGQHTPVTPFESGQNKKQELPIKKSGSDGVTAGKTVTRPIHKRTIEEGPLPMNKNLHPLVQEHAARNSDDERDQRWPPSFPNEKQYQRKDNNTDPLPGTEVGERVQHGNQCRSKAFMEPCRKLVISASKWIRQGERRHEVLREEKRVCHKRSGASLSPVRSKST